MEIWVPLIVQVVVGVFTVIGALITGNSALKETKSIHEVRIKRLEEIENRRANYEVEQTKAMNEVLVKLTIMDERLIRLSETMELKINNVSEKVGNNYVQN